jgi:hypothetical protein
MTKTATRRTSRTARPRVSREERNQKVTALAERLAEFRDSLDDDQIAAFEGRFDHYSARNAMLIVMQMPEATIVHGIKDWNASGRKVRKGESGIQILAPSGQREVPVSDGKAAPKGEQDEQTKTRQFFRLAYVFDISQTEDL